MVSSTSSPSPAALELDAIGKHFGATRVIEEISLSVAAGEFISLIGPSGCGKTTTLNIVAGFTTPDSGSIRIGGQSMHGVEPHRRGLGMVFQNHALFPHMTVGDNVAFGLRMRGTDKSAIGKRVEEALRLVRLEGMSERYPRQLSGGQQQRVGMARALAVRPRMLLMDEPLSSLDTKLRREMQLELRRIQRLVGVTALYVTHDQEEALTMSDRIVLMRKGRIEQIGAPEEVYSRPVSEFAASFVGEANFVYGLVDQPGQGRIGATLEGGEAIVIDTPGRPVEKGRVRLAVRPDRIKIVPSTDGGPLTATLVSKAFAGPTLRCVLDLGRERTLMADVAAGEYVPDSPETSVGVRIAPSDWLVVRENAQ